MKVSIGIVGARSRNKVSDFELLVQTLEPILEEYDSMGYDIEFVSGGCAKGGDRFAEILSKVWRIPIVTHYPDFDKLPEKPNSYDFRIINFERNTLIAKDSDILVAIVAEDRLGGTEDTITKFKNFYPDRKVILI